MHADKENKNKARIALMLAAFIGLFVGIFAIENGGNTIGIGWVRGVILQ